MIKDHKIRQLVKLVKMIDEGMLGADWETRQQLKSIKEKTLDQIKIREQEIKDKNVIK